MRLPGMTQEYSTILRKIRHNEIHMYLYDDMGYYKASITITFQFCSITITVLGVYYYYYYLVTYYYYYYSSPRYQFSRYV